MALQCGSRRQWVGESVQAAKNHPNLSYISVSGTSTLTILYTNTYKYIDRRTLVVYRYQIIKIYLHMLDIFIKTGPQKGRRQSGKKKRLADPCRSWRGVRFQRHWIVILFQTKWPSPSRPWPAAPADGLPLRAYRRLQGWISTKRLVRVFPAKPMITCIQAAVFC